MHKMHKIYMNTHSRVEITLCRWAIQKRPACNACALVVCAVMVEAVEDGGRKNVLIKFLTRRARANRGGDIYMCHWASRVYIGLPNRWLAHSYTFKF